jgi:riboflavin biosynthesis pyrimidine reductase
MISGRSISEEFVDAAPRTKRTDVQPLATLFEARRGRRLPLPARLARLYGDLRLPPATRPFVFSNFVTSLDGVVSLNVTGHASGGDISGFNPQDRMVMGLLRAVADAIVIGSGTLRADRRHLWTAAAIFPALAGEYRRLRTALGRPGVPLNVIVSGSGDIDLRLPIFTSGNVPVLICTTANGAKQLGRQRVSAAVEIRTIRGRAGAMPARAILAAACEASGGQRILVEGGPRLLGDFYAEGLVDAQFLTLAPQIAGRATGDHRLSLVMGKLFAPGSALWGRLVDARRGSSHLFLRYSFSEPRPHRSRARKRRTDQDGTDIFESASAAGRISELSTAKSPSATMPTSRLSRFTTAKRRT